MSQWSPVQVKCYSGYRADQTPLAFVDGKRRLPVETVLRTWREPDAEIFVVRAGDGKSYELRHEGDRWLAREA